MTSVDENESWVLPAETCAAYFGLQSLFLRKFAGDTAAGRPLMCHVNNCNLYVKHCIHYWLRNDVVLVIVSTTFAGNTVYIVYLILLWCLMSGMWALWRVCPKWLCSWTVLCLSWSDPRAMLLHEHHNWPWTHPRVGPQWCLHGTMWI